MFSGSESYLCKFSKKAMFEQFQLLYFRMDLRSGGHQRQGLNLTHIIGFFDVCAPHQHDIRMCTFDFVTSRHRSESTVPVLFPDVVSFYCKMIGPSLQSLELPPIKRGERWHPHFVYNGSVRGFFPLHVRWSLHRYTWYVEYTVT